METDRLVRKAGKTFTTWRPWLSIKPSANLAGLLALPCRIAEFSCVPPHNEEEKTVDPDELSTTNTKLLNNYFWQMVIYISNVYISAYITNYNPIHIYIYTVSICIQFCNWSIFAKFPTGPGLESSWYSRGLDCDRQRPQLWTSPSWVKPLSSPWSGSFAKHPRIPFAWTWVVKIKSIRMLCHYCQHCQHHYIATLLYYYITVILYYCNVQSRHQVETFLSALALDRMARTALVAQRLCQNFSGASASLASG